jgi:hypothetical protein
MLRSLQVRAILQPRHHDGFRLSSWDSEGNLLVPLHGIRIALGLSFLAACVFSVFTYLGDKEWHELNPGNSGSFVTPEWIWGLRVALVLVLFVISLLLLSTRSEHSKAAGAGVAFALFFSGLLLGIAGLVGVFLGISPGTYALPDVAAILAFLASSLWVVVSAIRIGKVSLGLFFLALVITAVCLTWGNHVLDDKDYELGRQYERQKGRAAVELFSSVESFGDC